MSISVLSNVIVVIEKSRKSTRIYPTGNISIFMLIFMLYAFYAIFMLYLISIFMLLSDV